MLRIHGPIVPVIEMKKVNYNETTNILEVRVFLNGGLSITDYSFTINYKNNIEPINYDNGTPINPDESCEIPINLEECSCGGGSICLTNNSSEDKTQTTTTNRMPMCTMKFKLKDNLLEEVIPNDLFTVEEAIIHNDGGTYEDFGPESVVNIGPMASKIESVALSDAKFDYTYDSDGDGNFDSYKCGDNINLIGGTVTITYSNTKNTTKNCILRKDETDETYKWFEIKNGSETGKILNITKGPWKADLEGTKNIDIDYKGILSNNVGVKVVDYIKDITINDDTPIYYYGEEFDSTKTSVTIDWAGKEDEIKTLDEVVQTSNDITGFNSTLDDIKRSSVEQDVTAVLNYQGYTGTKTFKVTIKDKVEEITLGEPTKQIYKYGEEALDLDGGTINVKWLSDEVAEQKVLKNIIRTADSDPVKEDTEAQGLKAAIDLNDSVKITGFDSSTLGTKPINLEYNYTDQDGNNQTKTGLTYNIEIVDYIESITLSDIKNEYLYGEEFESNVSVKWASKTDVETKTLKGIMEDVNSEIKVQINGFDSNAENIKKSIDGVQQNVTITFSYGEEEEIDYFNETTNPSIEVTVKDQIKNITFEEGTIKKDYEYKDPALDLTGGTINVQYLSEATDARPLNNIEIKTGSSPVTNNSVVASHLGDLILVTGFDSEQYGTQPITIKYYYAGEANPKEFTYNIKINTGIKSIDLNKNKITIPYGQVITDEYLVDNNYKVIITNSDDTTRDPVQIKAEWIGEYDKTKEKIGEEQESYVDYNGTQIPLYITIENCLDHIKLTKNIITIKWGEELNFTDEYKVIPVMANEDEEEGILFTDNKVQIVGEYNLKEEGTYNVKVTYEGKEADFTIIVVDPIIEVRLDDEEKEKIQKEYKYNEELNLNGAQLTIIRESSKEVGPYKETILKNWTDYDKEKLGTQKITINYKDDETQEVFTLNECFEVEVNDYIVDIILVRPNKTTYLPNEKLDLTGATVRTISASGKLGDEVAVTEDIISGYTEGILGAQRITVKYEGFEKTFDVIFTAQTGVANSNTYAMIATIIATASLTIVAMLTIIQKEEERNKKM